MIGVIDLARRADLTAQFAREGIEDAVCFGAESALEGFLRARGAGHDPIVFLPQESDPAAVAALIRALQRGLGDAAVLTPARPGLRGALAGGLLRALSGIDLRGLPSGPIALTADALRRVSVEAYEGPGFVTTLLLALHERGLRVIELPAGVGPPPRGLRTTVGLAARAWLARQRGVLGFEGPATLPRTGVPSVVANGGSAAHAGDAEQRPPKPLPLVSSSDELDPEPDPG